jgi:hypothetical protein
MVRNLTWQIETSKKKQTHEASKMAENFEG